MTPMPPTRRRRGRSSSTGCSTTCQPRPPASRQGVNDGKRTGYGGPSPPIGRHRYFFKLYALDTELPDLETPTKAELEQAMRGDVLDQAELIGTYEKKRMR